MSPQALAVEMKMAARCIVTDRFYLILQDIFLISPLTSELIILHVALSALFR
jgi:hypothetical protein